jgi:S-adenosylmethionine/arginine decarboxylase-like enzyme
MKLGERLDVVAITIKGHASAITGQALVEELVKVLGMHKVHEPIFYEYPVEGNGGNGFTYICPITESFIAFDAWPDFGGAYLIICSCKTVSLNKVAKKIRAMGFKIKQIKANELNLGRRNGF